MEVMSHASTFLLPQHQQQPDADGASLIYALVVLNQRLPRFVPLLWARAKLRVCADGGANRVYDDMPELFPDQDPSNVRIRYKPDVIKGDLDSIRDDVKDFYLNLGVKLVDESHDQDTTDLHKCVAYVSDSIPLEDKFKLCILVAGALGGRFDHEIGNINVLHRFSNLRIIFLSDDCLIHLLPKTHSHEIQVQPSVEGPHCGLIPIGAPSSKTTTTGLQWNLNDTAMGFGGLISTSNIVKDEKGVKLVDESHDQDTTDLHKCVAYVSDSIPLEDKFKLCILVAGALGGRFDHEIGNINVLHRFSNLRIIFLSDDCLIHLLPKTHSHEIQVQPSVEGPHCGLIPIGAPSSKTTTTGLQWNLNDTAMGFGGLISTSNIVKDEKGVKLVDESHDQDTTDLHKCVAYVSDSIPLEDKFKLCILVAGALGGRFDHEIGNINVLHRFSNLRIIFLSDDCLIHLLPKTHSHEIQVQPSVEGPHCGLIPIGAPSSKTTTTGLQWNLNDTAMGFGGLISTSNIVKDEKVTVSSDTDLVWTISIKKHI